MVNLKLISILLLLVISCATKEGIMNDEVNQAIGGSDEVVEPVKEGNASQLKRNFVIKQANYKFQTKDVAQSTKTIEAWAVHFDAFVADMNLVTENSEIRNNLIIRTPSRNFEALLDSLGKEAIFIDYKKITAEDVTEEFIDVQSRLNTKKEVRARYMDILKNTAKTIDEVLKAEDKIRIIQEEIEAKEGRLKYLQSRVSWSTINLEIYQKIEYQETPEAYEKPFIAKSKQAFSNGWDIVKSLTLFSINIWPVLFIGIIVYWRRDWMKERFNKKLILPKKTEQL